MRILVLCCVSLMVFACAQNSDSASEPASQPAAAKAAADAPSAQPATTESGGRVMTWADSGGMTVIEHQEGTGTEAVAGRPVTVHYTGWLLDEDAPERKGNKFDSSRDRDEPFRFNLGAGKVIKGWDEGVAGMRVGGRRTLIIPPEMAYGKRGYPPVIPASSTLVFDVQLLGVE